MAMEGINYTPTSNSNAVPLLNPQANTFQPDSTPSTAAPWPRRYGPITPYGHTGRPRTIRHNSGSQLDPQADDFQPDPHSIHLAYPPALAAQPAAYSRVPGMIEANAYDSTIHQQPANIPLEQIFYVQRFADDSVYPALVEQPNPVPFYQHQPGPPAASRYQAIPPAPAFATASNQHDFNGYGHQPGITSRVPSAPGSHQQTFNLSVINKNIPAQKFLNEMFIEPPQQATGPRAFRERAEAMSLWGEDSQDQLGVSVQRPSVSSSIVHAGKHLPLNSESIPKTQVDFPPLQIVEQDGITQPAVSGRGRIRRGPADPAEYKKTRTAGACVLCKIKRGSKPFGSVRHLHVCQARPATNHPSVYFRYGQALPSMRQHVWRERRQILHPDRPTKP